MNVQHVVDNELERQRLARLVVRNRVEQERAMERRRAEEEEEEEEGDGGGKRREAEDSVESAPKSEGVVGRPPDASPVFSFTPAPREQGGGFRAEGGVGRNVPPTATPPPPSSPPPPSPAALEASRDVEAALAARASLAAADASARAHAEAAEEVDGLGLRALELITEMTRKV